MIWAHEVARALGVDSYFTERAGDKFAPDQYQDHWRQRLQEAVDRKVAGEVVAAPETAATPSKVIDIMEALKQSLAREGRPAVPRPGRAVAGSRRGEETEARPARASGGKKK